MTTASTDPSSKASLTVERVSKNILVALLVIVCCVLGYVGFRICEAVLEADEAEHNLQAVAAVAGSLADFIDKNGRWPKDVAELRAAGAYDGGIYDWPQDEVEVLKRVQIRFDTDLTQVAGANADSFPWVSWPQSAPMFKRVVRERFRNLIARAQAKVEEKKTKAVD